MNNQNDITLILEEWVANLRSKNRKFGSVRSNFEELFEKWQGSGATRDDLFSTFLPKAIKAHQPATSIAKMTYKNLGGLISVSEKEFVDDWNRNIKDAATEAFFEYFPLEVEVEKKVYGNLGKDEYRHQRKLSAQFIYLDTTELEKRLKDNNQDLDLEDLKAALLGNGGSIDE